MDSATLGAICGVLTAIFIIITIILIICCCCLNRKRNPKQKKTPPDPEPAIEPALTVPFAKFEAAGYGVVDLGRQRSVSEESDSHGSLEDAPEPVQADPTVDTGPVQPEPEPEPELPPEVVELLSQHEVGKVQVKVAETHGGLNVNVTQVKLKTGMHDANSEYFCRVCLQPNPNNDKYQETEIKKYKPTILFFVKLYLPVATNIKTRQHLMVFLYRKEPSGNEEIVGEADVELAPAYVTAGKGRWFPLEQPSKPPDGAGEVQLSLCYMPTAERLTVVVLRARGLYATSVDKSADAFVQLSLRVQGEKVKRKTTPVKRDSNNPSWNEALVFNVPHEMLSKTSLEVHVQDHDLLGKHGSLGACLFSKPGTGTEAVHWSDMLENPRKAVTMWHTLKT